jgi:hypothetical protein
MWHRTDPDAHEGRARDQDSFSLMRADLPLRSRR